MRPADPVRRALVYGIAITGEAVAAALHARGVELVVADDAPTDAKRAAAERVGTELIGAPTPSEIAQLVEGCDVVCPAPGVPETHDVVVAAQAAGIPIVTELDLAYEWEQQRDGGPRPMLAVTGTDGKTTTTLLITAMLRAAGLRAVAVGNTELPLVGELDGDAEVFVVECSSFRLNWLRSFRAEASVWLNVAPDHQNWHTSLGAYEAAKAQMWAHLRPADVAVGNATDPAVMRNLADVDAVTRTFGGPTADYRVEGDRLVGPSGTIATTAEMTRALPHDVANALAAAAVVLESGLGDAAAVRRALASFAHPPHRIELVGEAAGVRWFNDSKATTPHAALTAVRGFERIVLLAGGRNKGLDLASLASEHDRVVAAVGLGEAGPEIVAAFEPFVPTRVASSMAEAVQIAAELARPGDVVLLSPACASFDWYPDGGYPARGDDFKRLAAEHLAAAPRTAAPRTAAPKTESSPIQGAPG
ncbi:MAG: murD [Ilumatobacteraceae bacterium]|nr:murD [Ilumatobacteraceae bacterium]